MRLKSMSNTATIRKRQPSSKQNSPSPDSIKEEPSSFKGSIICLTLIICGGIFYYFFLSSHSRHNNNSSSYFSSQSLDSLGVNSMKLKKSPTQYRTHSDGTEYLFQLPVGINIKYSSGIILFAHGCSHSATDWFYPSIECPKCIGLPEEISLQTYFLKQKYIVIVISSQNRQSKCWNKKVDTYPVKNILLSFKNELEIELLPVYAFGASSGGSFVGSLALNNDFINSVNLKGVIVQISVINIQDYSLLPSSIYIPVLFIPMLKDERSVKIANRELEILDRKKGDKISSICGIKEKAIDIFYFYRQISDTKFTQEISKKIHQIFKENGYIDAQDFLVNDPRGSNWRDILINGLGNDILNELNDNLIADQSPISEEMNVAYAKHEITSECKENIIDFIEAIQTNTK